MTSADYTNILDLTAQEAREFFLKAESYLNFALPKYFVFQDLLDTMSSELQGKELWQLQIDKLGKTGGKKSHKVKPNDYEGVNYTILNNKDGRFAWRPMQLIHPALYVELVHTITTHDNWAFISSRFKDFQSNASIRCVSIPVRSNTINSDAAASVNNWWSQIEQESIFLSLQFSHLTITDITDCYGSLYTHSIPWALHTKPTAKTNRSPDLLGNKIDHILTGMSYGQTNGIPQGSVLMDFIAEIILGDVDLQLSDRLTKHNLSSTDFQILRYRDDYRLFTHSSATAYLILKELTETLIGIGMKLSSQKTSETSNVIAGSIKSDKWHYLLNKPQHTDLQKHLLMIHKLTQEYPNSGMVQRSLSDLFNIISNLQSYDRNLNAIVSIVVDIVIMSPRTYPTGAAILSKLLVLVKDEDERNLLIRLVIERFSKVPNAGHIQIWLQRMLIKLMPDYSFQERLCQRVTNTGIQLWNSSWLNPATQTVITGNEIVDQSVIDQIPPTINSDEVSLFPKRFY